MPLKSRKTRLSALLECVHTRPVAGFAASESKTSVRFSVSPDAGTYDTSLPLTFDLAAGSSLDVDVRAILAPNGESRTSTSISGLILKAVAAETGGQLRLAPAGSNGLVWFFGDASDRLTLRVGTSGCNVLLWDGEPFDVSASSCTFAVSNPGTAAVSVSLMTISEGYSSGQLDFSDPETSGLLATI